MGHFHRREILIFIESLIKIRFFELATFSMNTVDITQLESNRLGMSKPF